MNTDGNSEKEKNQKEQNYESIEVLLFILNCVYLWPRKLEAAIGFEPMNEGFADLCLSHLATPP